MDECKPLSEGAGGDVGSAIRLRPAYNSDSVLTDLSDVTESPDRHQAMLPGMVDP